MVLDLQNVLNPGSYILHAVMFHKVVNIAHP